MRLLIDKYIPYIQGVLDSVADVSYLHYSEFTPDVIKDADALLIRTRTHCNKALLESSKVRFIGSAGIGIDHLDTDYLFDKHIVWTNAPASNITSVRQYVASALSHWVIQKELDIHSLTLGIVGVGNVGREVQLLAKQFGMRCLLNDPPREENEQTSDFVSLETIAQEADIITYHVPLQHNGKYSTHHLCDASFLESLKKKPLIVNAARGGVIDEAALKQALQQGVIAGFVIDCWENEPNLDLELLEQSFIGTPHIAGYSADGKANATTMVVQALSHYFNLGLDDFQVTALSPKEMQKCSQEQLTHRFVKIYDIALDSINLKHLPLNFESLRNHYGVRREVDLEVL